MHGKREEECQTQPEGAVAVEPEKQVPEQHSRAEEAAEFDILPPAFHASALLPAAEALSFF